MRSWTIRLSLLVLLTGFTHPAWAGTLNDLFTFQHTTYTLFHTTVEGTPVDRIVGHGTGGSYLGLGGDLTMFFDYLPDPVFGHPINRALHFSGVIPELGITDPNPPEELFQGVILADPVVFPNFLRFDIVPDVVHPNLGLPTDIRYTWDVPLPIAVPAPGAGLLLGIGALLGAVLARWQT